MNRDGQFSYIKESPFLVLNLGTSFWLFSSCRMSWCQELCVTLLVAASVTTLTFLSAAWVWDG